MTSVGTSTNHGLGQGLVPSKLANMEEWFLTSYEGLMDQTSAESLTAHLEHLQELSSPEHQAVPSLDYSLQKLMQIKSSLQPAAALSENEIKSAIIGHPQYRELVTAHMNCHKVGAPAELVAEMDELIQKHQEFDPAVKTSIGVNPELDQFMVAYVNVLNAYENEMKKTFKEAIEFCKKLEQQLSLISNGSIDALASGLSCSTEWRVVYMEYLEDTASSCRRRKQKLREHLLERDSVLQQLQTSVSAGAAWIPTGSNEIVLESEVDPAAAESDEKNDGYDEEVESGIGADVDLDVDPLAGDKELKQMLMRKYGAFIKGLTQEYLKKKKKGKLPKESRQKLLDWWSQHQDHPYPSEVQKASLAQSTGLDPKQINNWFINQRKRHWNPGAAATSRGESSQQGNSS